MINNTDFDQNPDFNAEGNSPQNSANEGSFEGESKLSVGKLKSYGKKSLAPLVNLVHKYQDEITPYFDAISKGLQGGVDALSQSSSTSTGPSIPGAEFSSGSVDAFASGGSVGSTSGAGMSEAETVVAGWFREASQGLSEARTKLQSSNSQDMIDYIELQARNHPGFMFSSSYLAGLFFGRIGKHIGRKKFGQSSSNLNSTAGWNSGDSMTH